MYLYHGKFGDVVRRLSGSWPEGTYEVRTDLTTCIVDVERDDDGEYFVDLPANWLHTDEEAAEARHKARMAFDEYLDSLQPSLKE